MGALSALAGAALLLVGGPFAGSAQAAGLCGGHQVRTLSFSTGKTVVYRNRDYVCAVTIARKSGTRQTMSAGVQARGSRAVVDSGRFTHHAGPVTVHAGHRCVRITGRVGSKTVKSGWILC
ncbi:hypothetical protein GTW43_32040 [Streptomyces sp. SID5785]|uniref:hypothetical protein n=1 Tax=Streptomyces sp. SID5785 TaxID=2690309 RepID=UPI001360E9F5|nr:hypothetical protein [Streptomyces sp. SID5785]MZD09678.1 hypothetical protein [Streptomyces sp. SID5785]